MIDQKDDDTFPDTTLIELTAGVVQSYFNNNQMQPDQVPQLMQQVHDKFIQLQGGTAGAEASNPAETTGPQHEPPVKPKNSVRKNDVVCLECGKTYKTLKRHIRTEHGLEESGYKARWDLPASMKLVAKSYSEQRSQMARDLGLGEKASARGRGRKKG
jgi:predicted transcriptional regulator